MIHQKAILDSSIGALETREQSSHGGHGGHGGRLKSVISGLLPGFGFSQPWPGRMNAKRTSSKLPEQREQNSRHPDAM
jgi:hypothetical protein